METLLIAFISALIIILLGMKLFHLSKEKRALTAQMAALEEKNSFFQQNLQQLQQEKAILSTECSLFKEQLELRKSEIEKTRAELKQEFELLTHKIFESKSTKFQEDTDKQLKTLLSPFKERLSEFQKQVQEAYKDESRERFALKKQLDEMISSTHKISEEAHQLAQAFKGNVKAQGIWGEMILENVLEASGLRKNIEYHPQAKDFDLKSEEGSPQRPDVIISLPDDKHVIIDAKISLISYERYLSEKEEDKKEGHLKQLVKSLQKHIDDLHKKNYQQVKGLNPPDFVLMFIPIEGLLSLSVQQEPNLFSYAWEHYIVLVSPATLLATLKTIHALWKQQNQNKNTLEILRQGGLLYDKFVNFVEELEKLGDSLNRSQLHFDEVIRKLKTGKGNLMARVENLKKLGAKTTKSLDLSNDFIEIESES